MATSIPHIKITCYTHPYRTWRPNCKIHSLHAIYLHDMSAHLLVYIIIDACFKFFKLPIFKLGGIGIWIPHFLDISIVIGNYQCVICDGLLRNQHCKKTWLLHQFHRIFLTALFHLHGYLFCCRNECLYKKSLFCYMWSQHLMRISCF